jgi:thiamine pyrophosphokinase
METTFPVGLAVIIADAPVAAIEPYVDLIHQADLRVAADGGARHYLSLGILPHVAIGDFDSLPAPMFAALEQDGVQIKQHAVYKDETDLELALLHAVERGARQIVVLAALGGRPDQHVANLQLLTHQRLKGLDVRLRQDSWDVFVIHTSTRLEGIPGQTVSLLPMTERVEGITTQGLYYPLNDEPLLLGPARGVSNKMTEIEATITIRSGMLLVMHERANAS